MANLQFRSERILNFIFLSNKLLSPRSIHSFFLSTLHEIHRLCSVLSSFFSSRRWFFFSRFELVFDSIESYFYSLLPSTAVIIIE